MATRKEAIDFLRALSDKELAEVFHAAVEGRCTSDSPAQKGHFVLAGSWFPKQG